MINAPCPAEQLVFRRQGLFTGPVTDNKINTVILQNFSLTVGILWELVHVSIKINVLIQI